MVSSNGKEATIKFFLVAVRARNPTVVPALFMSDFAWEQLNSIRAHYPESQLVLCWWHVLHAWQQHFTVAHYPDMWVLLKKWIRLTDCREFMDCWVKIQKLAPSRFILYLENTWLKNWCMWSATECQNRTIFELSDTNMLVEAYVFCLFNIWFASWYTCCTDGITYLRGNSFMESGTDG